MEGESSADLRNGQKDGGERVQGNQVTGRRLDAVFDALADARRRYVLQYFRNCSDDVATVTDLADYVTKRTGDDGFEQISVALYHKDVPKLADAGLVEYDSRTETVRFVGSKLVYELLDRADDRTSGERSVYADAVEHLYEALAVDDPVEKDYLVRQALQHIHFERDQ